jgi:hypothetical protein
LLRSCSFTVPASVQLLLLPSCCPCSYPAAVPAATQLLSLELPSCCSCC